jgi:hypothetical protein
MRKYVLIFVLILAFVCTFSVNAITKEAVPSEAIISFVSGVDNTSIDYLIYKIDVAISGNIGTLLTS